VPAATVDAGVMTQLMLSYLAAGFRGFGFWCWSARTAGTEAGEYAILDRNLQPCERSVRMGHIGRAARRLRDELWAARKEPLVGVFNDFDSEAIWAAMAVNGRDHYKHWGIRARIGVSRALINANVPWEYVTARDLRAGLAPRYKAIVLPATLGIARDVLDILREYVRGGGRVVMDCPGAWYDEYGRLLATGEGTAFGETFGCTIRDYQYSRNVPRSIDDRRLEGFVADLGLLGADVLATYDTGAAAVTENRLGDGTAVFIGCEAARMCDRPGDADAEARLLRWTLGELESPYACDGAIVYRQAAPAADHYFLINDGPAATTTLDTKAFRYARAEDAVTQEELPPGEPIDLEAYSGRWLRMVKA
jgi:beta-galactosidase